MSQTLLPAVPAARRARALLDQPRAPLGEWFAVARSIVEWLRCSVALVETQRPEYAFFEHAGRLSRPVSRDLFMTDPNELDERWREMQLLADRLRRGGPRASRDGLEEFIDGRNLDRLIYTIAQALGVAIDLLDGEITSRKDAGDGFEALVRALFAEIGLVAEKRKLRLAIPGTEMHSKFEIDAVVGRGDSIDGQPPSPLELSVAIKTTTKDRQRAIFGDAALLAELLGRRVPTVFVGLHDVQRSRSRGVTSAFLPGHWALGLRAGHVIGAYYCDPPPLSSLRSARYFEGRLHTLQQLVLRDIWSFVD